MKSKLIRLADFHGLWTEPILYAMDPAEPDTEVSLERDKLLLGAKRQIRPDRVAEGDMVLLNLSSDLPRFCRDRLPVTVGLGLFSPELEAALPGRRPGESFSVSLPEGEVQAEILSCVRTELPPYDDALIAAQSIPGVETVEAFEDTVKQRYLNDMTEALLDAYAGELLERWCDACAWSLDPAEVENAAAAWIQMQRASDELHDMVLAEADQAEQRANCRHDAALFLKLELLDRAQTGRPDTGTWDITDVPALQAVRARVLAPLREELRPYFTLRLEEP